MKHGEQGHGVQTNDGQEVAQPHKAKGWLTRKMSAQRVIKFLLIPLFAVSEFSAAKFNFPFQQCGFCLEWCQSRKGTSAFPGRTAPGTLDQSSQG